MLESSTILIQPHDSMFLTIANTFTKLLIVWSLAPAKILAMDILSAMPQQLANPFHSSLMTTIRHMYNILTSRILDILAYYPVQCVLPTILQPKAICC